MLNAGTILGLLLVSGFSTLSGSVPVFFHRRITEEGRSFWESFGGGVMMSASVFSLFLPSLQMIQKTHASVLLFFQGIMGGVLFIFLSAFIMKRVTENIARRRAYLFVFVMALHNIPEGLSVGFDVAALGWEKAMPLCVAIFIQNLPEGFVSSLTFFLAGFSLPASLLANAVTAVIESVSAIAGFQFVKTTSFSLPLLLAFAGASMMTVVLSEIFERRKREENFSVRGLLLGLVTCAFLDLFL